MAAEPSTMVQSKRRPSPDAHDEPSSNRKRINFDEDTEEAITKEEMEGIKSPTTASLQPPTKPRNACKIHVFVQIHMTASCTK